ncbi:MAG: hypothetical protein E7396_01050 [Ruminococcaceae bacterium]|nr:hypothetical protein [Oscillospiraceae bacterium]
MSQETITKVEVSENNTTIKTNKSDKRKPFHKLYIFVITAIFTCAFVQIALLPRSVVSERENRKLAEFPKFSISSLLDGTFTSDINVYFSDTVPNRDHLTEQSAAIKDKSGFRVGGIKIHKPVTDETNQQQKAVEEEINEDGVKEIKKTEANINLDDNATLGRNGILVSGTRGLMLFGGDKTAGKNYAEVVNEYKRQLGENVNVYCVPIPTSIEFYCPPSYKDQTISELDSINNILGNLEDGIKGVDVYTPLSKHCDEEIYFRTDHHWAPLGAYYAAESFAKVAKVDFKKLDDYEKVVKKGFVGTLYNFSGDIVLKQNPEDFVYYKPKNVEYTTTYYPPYSMDMPTSGDFFQEYDNVSPLLYNTFMGGDDHITHVHSNVNNGRRLVIFKDSYGNAFSSFIIGSFEDLYVIDMRYFQLNSIEFMKKYQITDVAFVNNVFHTDTYSTAQFYRNFLSQ